jgi:hypothetical protein
MFQSLIGIIADFTPDYLDFKAKTIAMKQEYLNGLAA